MGHYAFVIKPVTGSNLTVEWGIIKWNEKSAVTNTESMIITQKYCL